MESKVIQRSYEEDIDLDIMLHGVLSNLRKIDDIHGSMLVLGNNSIFASDMPDFMDPDDYFHGIMNVLNEKGMFDLNKVNRKLFGHHIFDYNGYKVLAKKIRNFTLLVMLKKMGYVGLAMLDIENSAREIDQIMQSTSDKYNRWSLLNQRAIFLVPDPDKRKSSITSLGEKNEYR